MQFTNGHNLLSGLFLISPLNILKLQKYEWILKKKIVVNKLKLNDAEPCFSSYTRVNTSLMKFAPWQ